MHLKPNGSLLGAGIWRPEPGALRKIREAIRDDQKRWQRITSAEKLVKCKMGGASLRRPPRGYDPNHPLIEDIKRKDFTVGMLLTDNEVIGGNFLQTVLKAFRQSAPFVGFLSEAVGLP